MQPISIIITKQDEGKRIDIFLSNFISESRSYVQKLIKQEVCLVNNNKIDPKYMLKLNDIITYTHIKFANNYVEPHKIDFNIIYEDEYLAIIDKPAFISVHNGTKEQPSLVSGLKYYFKELSDTDETRPGIVHRLDKDTSGLMIIAKENRTHALLSEMIKNKEVERRYMALIYGAIKPPIGTIKTYIRKHPKIFDKMQIISLQSARITDERIAITHYKNIKEYDNISLIEVKLETGRTHQIRAHMEYLGNPIVGDLMYNQGQKKVSSNIQELIMHLKRQALHSYYIKFIHPITQESIEHKIDLPNDIKNLLLFL